MPTSTPSATIGVGSARARAGDLFQILRDGEPRTRAELATMTGLARSTIVARIESLIRSGLVTAVGEAASSGGRPPSRFALNPRARVILAIDLGATHAIVAIADLAGIILSRTRAAVDISDAPEVVLDLVIRAGQKLLGERAADTAHLAGVGIGLPGPVEHSTGRPVNPPIMPGWDGFDVPGYVQHSFDVPVLVDNDVNMMALGEQSAYWPDHQNLLFVKAATGIGAGIVSGGRLQRGAEGSAGDLGHVSVARGGDVVCRCGNSGCLEALAGGPAIARALAADGVLAHSNQEIIDLVRHADSRAIAALRTAGRDIGEVLATCVNLLNPSIIVIGGSMATAGEHLLAGIREIVYKRSLPLATVHLGIVRSKSGEDAGILGASIMVIQQVLSADAVEDLLAA